MRSFVFLLLFAEAVFASSQYGWQNGKQYIYKIRSRTVASFNQNSKYYTGIAIEGHLIVQSINRDTLRATIAQPRYSQIHTRFEEGWDSEIPQDKLNLQNFPLSGKAFDIKVKKGVVRDLEVDKDVPTWEVNVIKSIVSQLQIDTQGENAKYSKHNHFPETEQPYGLYLTMEDSVTGKCEVLYDISPLPEQILRNHPELVPVPQLRADGDFISIVKTKNYTNCNQRSCYHFNIDERNNWEPGSNVNGKFLARSSLSRIVISGNVKKYTIQSSVTINKIIHNADFQENEQGMVASKVNLTLYEVKDISEQLLAPSNLKSTGNLVYSYNNRSGSLTSRPPSMINRLLKKQKDNDNQNSEESSSVYDNDGNNYLQPLPKMTDAPSNPLLSYFIGNLGNSIQKNNKINAIKSAKDIALQIGNDIEEPDRMSDEETLEKFSILTRLVRTMNAEQIAEVQRELYEQQQSSNQLNQRGQVEGVRRNAWVAFRDAVAQAGTASALMNIKQWIQFKIIQGTEAANVLDTVAKSARTPTPEYVNTFFELVKSQEVKDQPVTSYVAIFSFADLVRNAIVNKRSAHHHYPVHAFGRFFSKDNHDVNLKYIPYMAEELKTAFERSDSKNIQVYITAIGKTGHPQMLTVFQPYLEEKKQISRYQRLIIVLSLNKLAETYPKVARSVLYKIYSNNAEHYEIRTAAVYLLMKTKPSASLLQRMAEYTNYDSNKQVNSAVKSTIESLAQLHDHEIHDLIEAARAAQPLLTSENYGIEYSQAFYTHIKNYLTHSESFTLFKYIGSDDSIIPKAAYISSNPTFKGIKIQNIDVSGAVSSVNSLWNSIQYLSNNKFNNDNYQKAQDHEYSPENIAKLLNINSNENAPLEGFASIEGNLGNYYLPFNERTIQNIPIQLMHLAEEMKTGKHFEATRLRMHEITMSFPTDTGFPFHFTLKLPTLISISGRSQLRTEYDVRKKFAIPKAVAVVANTKIVYGMQIQKRLGIVTPFEHQEYLVGIDRNIQLHLPLYTEVAYNQDKYETRIKIQSDENIKEFNALQYKSQPFTSKHDILSLEPISKDRNTNIIRKDHAKQMQTEINDKENKERIQFSWERSIRHGEESEIGKEIKNNAANAVKNFFQSISSLYSLSPADAEYQKYSVKLYPSSDLSAEMRVSFDSSASESNNNADSKNSLPRANVPFLDEKYNAVERKQKLLKGVSANINSAKASAVDVNLQLDGVIQSSLTITAAYANSHVDEKSRVLLYSTVKTTEDQDYYLSGAFEGRNPNVKTLDYEETLKANTPRLFDVEINYGKLDNGNNKQVYNKLKIEGELKQTEKYKNEVLRSCDAQICSEDEQQTGNKMTPSCQKVNYNAASVNEIDVTIHLEKESESKRMIVSGLDFLGSILHQHSETQKYQKYETEKNTIKLHAKMPFNSDELNILVQTPMGNIHYSNVKHYYNGKNRNNKNINDMVDSCPIIPKNNVCNLDKTQTKTFDNHRYSLLLGDCWHVIMTAYPKNNPERQSQYQEIPENMHATILAKENDNGRKNMKIIFGENEIKLTSSPDDKVYAKINDKEVEYSQQQSYQMKQKDQVIFELFNLADNSVSLISDKYSIKIIYDGRRAQIEVGDRYRHFVRGLCGNYDGEPENDQQTPKGCLLQKSEEFVSTYALTNDNKCRGPATQNLEKTKKSTCYYEAFRPGNVINRKEISRYVHIIAQKSTLFS